MKAFRFILAACTAISLRAGNQKPALNAGAFLFLLVLPVSSIAAEFISVAATTDFIEAVKDGKWAGVEQKLARFEEKPGAEPGEGAAELLQVALGSAPEIREQLESWLEDARSAYQYAYFKSLVPTPGQGYSGESMVWLHRASDRGNPDARATLGGLYLHGFRLDGVEVRNPQQGLEWLARAAQDGSFAARRDLAFAHANGIGFVRDPSQAFELLSGLQKEGYAPAAADLAEFYLDGVGPVARNTERARELLEEASRAGDEYASYRLYELYLDEGSSGEDRKAFRALERAANGGVIPALIRMARWHVAGYILQSDPAKAMALARAAERRVRDGDFSARGRNFYLRQIYRVQVDAAMLAGNYPSAQVLLDTYADLVSEDIESPIQGRMDDYAVIAGYLDRLGNSAAAQGLSERMLDSVRTRTPGGVQEVALQVQLAQMLMDAGQSRQANRVFSNIKAFGESHGLDDPVIVNLVTLARGMTGIQGNYRTRARASLEKAHSAFTQHLGEENQYSAIACVALGRSWLRSGKPGTADRWFRTAFSSQGDERVDEFPKQLRLSMQLVEEFRSRREYVYAEKWSQRALKRLRRRASMLHALGRAALPGEKQLAREVILQHLHLQEARKGVRGGFGSAEWVDAMFQLAQLVEELSESTALARFTLHREQSEAGEYGWIYQRDRLATRIERLRQDYLQARAAGIDSAQGALMVRAVNALVEQHRDAERQLEKTREAPGPENLGQVSSVAKLKEVLDEEEVLIQFVLGEKRSSAWLVTRSDAIIEFLEVGRKKLDAQAAEIKRGLDPYGYGGTGRSFPKRAAQDLYAALFQPLEAWLSHIKKINLVPGGPLAEVPVSVLRRPVAYDPDAPGRGYEWFVQRFANAYLPSAKTLVELRKRPVRKRVDRAGGFLAVADPILGSGESTVTSLDLGMFLTEQGSVKGRLLAELPPLPDSREVARTFSELAGSPKILLFGRNANETQFLAQRLVQNRQLLIGSHGIVGGPMRGGFEPGLVLTPPAVGSTQDDGWLSATEIAGLRLNAPLIILPAVNSVSAQAGGDSEGFRTLSRAFFHAGAQAQVISHWPVPLDAARAMAVEILRADEPGVDGAEALQAGMLNLLERGQRDLDQQPGFWGALSYVGP